MFVAPVRVATTAAITLSGEQTIDGLATVSGDRVLVKDQAAAADNGIYVVAAGAWSRATDFDDGSEVVQGSFVLVLEGATQAELAWVLMTANPIVVGTTPLVWQVFPDLSDYVTNSGTATLSNKTFAGQVDFVTDGDRIGITTGSAPLSPIEAIVHIVNDNASGVGLLVTSKWEGQTASPYVNNDNSLFTTYNRILSDSSNRSWGASINNAYNDIPAGVTDGGERVGAIGWATSVAFDGYVHAGTLAAQTGLLGTAGFQGAGSAATAVIVAASGVRGLVYADAPGATIRSAFGGSFASDGGASTVERSYGVYARGRNGTIANYSFYGEAGKLFNAGQIAAGTEFSQSPSSIAARLAGNGLEFGHPSATGYGSNLGATFSLGYPFVAFCGEADPTGDTFRTRGKKGAVVWSDLVGSLVFSRLTDADAAGQNLVESARFDANGNFSSVGTGTFGGALAAASLTLTTDLALTEGGTGASTAAGARTNLGLGTAAVLAAGAAGGVATLDGAGKVPTVQLPALALSNVFTVASQAAQLALSAQEGDIAIRTDQSKTYANNGGTSGTMADWSELLTPTDTVLSVNGQTGAVSLVASNIGSSPTGDVSATNVQAAIAELASEKVPVSSYTPADVLAKLLTVDGAGSGLDADLLDGQSSAYYLARVNHTGTQLAATISDFATAADARIAASIGVSVQAYDADLTTLGAGGAGARSFLGLGTAAVKNTGTSGDAVPLLNGGATTWAAGMTIGGNVNVSGQVAVLPAYSQSPSSVTARKGGNSFEFGHFDAAGYGSNIGATFSHGYPFVAFCGEADPTGNTFRTRGKKGAAVWSDLTGALIFSRLANANASGQSLTESARFDPSGHMVFAETPVLKQKTPASASAAGIAGEVCWDASYLYVCTATNTWKRVALSSW